MTDTFESLSRDILFARVWNDGRLSKRDRSLVTLGLLIAQQAGNPLDNHLFRGTNHGLTEQEIRALVNHVAFYVGWPAAEHANRKVEEFYGHGREQQECRQACCRTE